MSMVDKAAKKNGGPMMAYLYGEAPPRLQVYERVGKPVNWVSERAEKG